MDIAHNFTFFFFKNVSKYDEMYGIKDIEISDITLGGSTNLTKLLSNHDDSYKQLIEEFHRSHHLYTDAKSILLIVLYIPVFVLALLGNALVVLVILPNQHMRSLTNCFIVNLGLADLTGKVLYIFLVNLGQK